MALGPASFLRSWRPESGSGSPAAGLILMSLAALLVSGQMPLAALGASLLLPAVAYGAVWRLGVFMCAGAVGTIFCRGRLPPLAAFRDWRLWVGLLSFLDTLLIAFAVRLVDPLAVLAVVQVSPLLFAMGLRFQLGLRMAGGRSGWFRLLLACFGAAVAVGAGRAGDAVGAGWFSLASGLGLALLAALAMAVVGFTFGWSRDWAPAGDARVAAGNCCLASALGSLLSGGGALLLVGAPAGFGDLLPAMALFLGCGFFFGGGQAVFYRLAWFAPAATLARGGLMPVGPSLGALWLLLSGLTQAGWFWVLAGCLLALGSAAQSVRAERQAT